MSYEVKTCVANEVGEKSEKGLPVVEPRVDVFETGEAVVVLADLPGVEESTIRVDLEHNRLLLGGVSRRDLPEGVKAEWRELRDREYRRSFRLGDRIDRSAVAAKYRNGVLRVELPFRAETRPVRVDVSLN